jgi:hypothetical protein
MYVRTALVAALLAITTATASHAAATDRDRFLSRIERYAVYVGTDKVATIVDAVAKGRMACVCTETGSLSRRPGVLTVGEGADGLITFCAIPQFDADGALELAVGCQSFIPLAK